MNTNRAREYPITHSADFLIFRRISVTRQFLVIDFHGKSGEKKSEIPKKVDYPFKYIKHLSLPNPFVLDYMNDLCCIN